MQSQFTSKLNKHIEAFLAEKHALGYIYAEGERYLRHFDEFCQLQFPDASTITKKLAMSWATAHPNENKVGMVRRLSPVRELSRFLQRRDIDAYVIPNIIGGNTNRNFSPHIFTDSELQKIFQASDNLRGSNRQETGHIVAPIMLRLMYCCGLRPFEARQIKRADINMTDGFIFIPESKMRRDRYVVMPDEMVEYCYLYDQQMRKYRPDSEYFFPANNNPDPVFDRHWLARVLERSLNLSGLTEFSGGHPRPYDFRHTFATKTLYRWFREGRDLDAWLPYLSAYMGHANFAHTAYYLHLVPEFFLQLPDKFQKQYAELLPEVPV